MASNLVKPPISASHVVPPIPITRISKMRIRAHRSISATNPNNSKNTRFAESSCGLGPIRVAEPSSSSGFFVGSEEQLQAEPIQIKADLYEALQDTNRGIFGVPSAKKSEIEGLVKLLESKNPTPEPTLCMEKVGGCWKLVYSTITILGSKRTKLGLRDFITLGDIFQIIDVTEGKAVNVIMFNVTGLNLFRGQLRIEAFFKTATKSRVEIKYSDSKIIPDQLMNVFQNNYNLLLGIFNPEGWLEITYVDDTTRIGRDDKGNIFILERYHEENHA